MCKGSEDFAALLKMCSGPATDSSNGAQVDRRPPFTAGTKLLVTILLAQLKTFLFHSLRILVRETL